ncbi:hypothetical protein DB88DRAFT_493570 [Papiliotrema laurentii]|uniref:Uncharacterized protein n=1 Tax=Papiliotrema laurentii TaxID=5418 RepID=A0AAD9CW39_PAPLA|nr:hypothetical protein DB88DRAFT_503528 [Papiliotrema laurentii]KAK1923044.1 hypothetical protein DB88DRAFT_493570 [Papiliotrema laurentii]
MFCLRKRQLLNTQAEDLARLRPPPLRYTNHSEAAETDATDKSRNHGSKTTATTKGGSWSPFEALRRRLDPYSFIYVRGTPDGVVGRYMEEVEYDDGQYDFGSISRGASDLAKRRREENRWEWLDWGDHGSLLYLPLTSLFHPILAIPENLSRILTPSYTFLTRYYNSFADGSQLHAWESFKKEVHEGGAVKLVQRMAEHNRKKAMEKREEIRKIQSQEKDRLEKMKKMHKGFDEKEVDER